MKVYKITLEITIGNVNSREEAKDTLYKEVLRIMDNEKVYELRYKKIIKL